MSWEEMGTKKISCPCGKGFISQTEYGDDWNRYEYSSVIIECDNCKNKYKVESEYHCCYKPGHGNWTVYYLLPIDYPEYDGIKEHDVYPIHNLFDVSFHEYLMENYSENSLISAKNEYQLKKSSSKVTGFAKNICKDHKRRFNTVKYKLVLEQINKAIVEYSSYTGNYEQREIVRQQEKKERAEYDTKKEKYRKKINL